MAQRAETFACILVSKFEMIGRIPQQRSTESTRLSKRVPYKAALNRYRSIGHGEQGPARVCDARTERSSIDRPESPLIRNQDTPLCFREHARADTARPAHQRSETQLVSVLASDHNERIHPFQLVQTRVLDSRELQKKQSWAIEKGELTNRRSGRANVTNTGHLFEPMTSPRSSVLSALVAQSHCTIDPRATRIGTTTCPSHRRQITPFG